MPQVASAKRKKYHFSLRVMCLEWSFFTHPLQLCKCIVKCEDCAKERVKELTRWVMKLGPPRLIEILKGVRAWLLWYWKQSRTLAAVHSGITLVKYSFLANLVKKCCMKSYLKKMTSWMTLSKEQEVDLSVRVQVCAFTTTRGMRLRLLNHQKIQLSLQGQNVQ